VVTNKVSRLAVEQSRVVHRGFATRSLTRQLPECELLVNRTTRFRIMVHASAPVAKFFVILLRSSKEI
jgi:hypothetical protein